MNRDDIDWRGYIPAITTTFREDGSYDPRGHTELLEWLLAEGMHGVIALGTTGEWFSLVGKERSEVLNTVAATLKGKIPIIAGCNDYTVDRVAANMEAASNAGFDGILLTPPPYISLSEDEIFEFYKAAAKRTKLPICIYNWPPGTNTDLSLPLIERLIEIDNIVALKNSTGRLDHFINTFFALHERVRVFGISTDELGLTLTKYQNADGIMGAGAVLGRDHPGFFNAIWRGDLDTARELGARDRILMQDWFLPNYMARFGSPQALLKEALNLRGLPGGYPRQPILPLSEGARAQVAATMKRLGKI